MERGSTLFLRATVISMASLVLIGCAFMLPAMYSGWHEVYPNAALARIPAMIGLTISAVAFCVAVYQSLKLLGYIDKGTAFSDLSVNALRAIKYCALVISGVYILGMPLIYDFADRDDAPGLIIIGMFFVFAPIVIFVFAAVMQRLLQSVIAIKSENDLTV